MRLKRDPLAFAAAVFGLWAFFLVQAVNTPVLLDDWYQLTWHRHHALSFATIWEYAHYNYFHFNPRVGDVLLMLMNGPRVIHLVATPLVQVALLWLVFALALGRWPRARIRDLQLLLVIQVAIWIVIPIPGIIYFYRPFATNYLWAFATTLALFVPYRLELARAAEARPRYWLVPVMLVVGWIAGMSNEHTGPTVMVAVAVAVAVAWRTGRFRAWMAAGMVGLYVGYPMLFLAPGQHERYAGIATRNTPVRLLAERGLAGCFEIVVDFVGESQLGIWLAVLAVLLYIGAKRSRGETTPALTRPQVATIALLVAAAGSIVVTLFASPTVGERLFFASGLLLVAAIVAIVDLTFAERAARRVVVGLCLVIFGYHVIRFVAVSAMGKAENDQRIALLRAAPAVSVAVIPPYKMWKRTRWWWGDDLRYASLREYIANEVYDLRGIEYDRHIRWSEPTPPDQYVATRTFEPPLPPEVAARTVPLRYIPTFWEWTLVQLRRAIVLDHLGDVDGHRLVRYVVDVQGSAFADPKHRPFHVLDWTPHALVFLDGRQYDDLLGLPYVRVWADSVPADLTDTYAVGCGTTTRVEPQPDREEHVGPLIPITLACRGTYTAVMCTPTACWLAGRYWR